MMSQKQQNEALQIAQFVLENGRVEANAGKINPASMESEVEFEAAERGHDSNTAAEMGKYAASNSQ